MWNPCPRVGYHKGRKSTRRSNVLLVTTEWNQQTVSKQRTLAEYHSCGRFPHTILSSILLSSTRINAVIFRKSPPENLSWGRYLSSTITQITFWRSMVQCPAKKPDVFTDWLTLWSWALFKANQLCNHSVVSQHFMEPEGSLPQSQELSTCPYPEPDKSSPNHPIPRLQDIS
jgi:hypothetical protein